MAINGKYIYNMSFKAIDYCNNIGKGATTYSEYFSPNNIRRLIISPDVVCVEFYISVPGIGGSKMIRIPSTMLTAVENLPDYVPIVQIISTSRICSSIEEIIFLVRSNDGQVMLGAKEYDFASLVANFSRRGGDILETIKQRYVRLRDIVIIQGNYNQFRQLKRTKDDLISELEGVRGYAEIKPVHTESDWYTKWGNPAAAKTYPLMDGVGDHLHNYFTRDIEKRKEAERAKGLNDYKRERSEGARREFEEVFEKLYSIMKMSAMLKKLIQRYGLTEGISIEIPKVSSEPLFLVEGLKDYPETVQIPVGMDLNEAYRKNTEACKKMIQFIVLHTSKQFIENLADLYEGYALTAQVMLGGRDIHMIVPSGLESKVDMLSQKCHCTISGNNILADYQTFCHLTCLFFLNRSNPEFKMQYTTAEFWKGR